MSSSLPVLSDALEAARTGGGLTITAGQTGVPALDAFLASLPAGSLTLERAHVQVPDQQQPGTMVVSGELPGGWPLPGLSSALTRLAVTISLVQPGPQAAVSAGLTVTATVTAGGQALTLTGSLAQPAPGLSPALTFDWPHQQLGSLSLREVAALATEGRAAAALPAEATPLDSLHLCSFNLTFGYAAGTPTIMQFSFATDPGATWEIVPGKHVLEQVKVTFAASCQPSPAGSRFCYGGYVTATLDTGKTPDTGKPLEVTVGLQPGRTWQVDLVADQGLPTLADLAALFGVQAQVQSALQAVGLGDITLTAARLGIDRTTRALSYGSLQGTLSLAGKLFDLRIQLPDFGFSGTLSSATPMRLTELLEHLMGDAGGLPDVAIDELSLWSCPASGSYSLTASVADSALRAGGRPLTDVMLQLERQGSSVTGVLGATLPIAGGQIAITGSYGAGWVLAGEASTLSLSALLADVLADVPLPAPLVDLEVSQATMTWSSSSGSFACAGSVDLSIDLGPMTLATTLGLAVGSMAGQGATGSLAGSVSLGRMAFRLLYELQPGQQVLCGTWDSQGADAGFADLALAFGIQPPAIGLTLPDLGLRSLSFEADLSAAGQQPVRFTATTSLGEAFFLVDRPAAGQPWAFVFGAAIDHATRISQLLAPAGLDSQALDFIRLCDAYFLVSSAQFPALPVPAALGGQPTPVGAGATAGLLLDLAGSSSRPEVAALRSLLPGNPAVLTAQLCVGDSLATTVVTGRLGGNLAIDAGGGSSITLGSACAIMRFDPVAIGLLGSIVIPVDGQQIEAAGMLTVSPAELTASLAVEGTGGQVLPFPMGLPGVHLTDLSVEVGATFEPPSAMLGVLGRFVVGPGGPPSPAGTAVAPRPLTAMPPPDEFVMVIGIEGDIPNPVLLSMYLLELSLADAVEAFINQQLSLPGVLTGIMATDLMIYWCDVPAGIQQPDGTWAYPGFGFNCTLDLYGFLAHAGLKVEPASGITGSACISPVRIDGVLELAGDGPGTPAEYQGQVTVQPGGPQVQVSTLGCPYLDLAWRLTLFSTLSETVNAQVTKQGLTFEVTGAGPGFSSTLQCSLQMPPRLQVSFSVRLDLDIDLGTVAGVNLGTLRLGGAGLDASLLAAVEPASLTVDGSLEVDGVRYTMPELAVTVPFRSLAQLPGAIADQVEREVTATFASLYDSASAYASLARQAIVAGADEIGSVMCSAYDLTAEQAAATMKDVDYAADQVAQAFQAGYDVTDEEAARLLRTAGYGATDVASALEDVWDTTADTAACYLKAVGYGIDDIGSALQDVFNLAPTALNQALSLAGYATSEIEGAFSAIGADFDEVASAANPANW
ncbi:MAG TPA: hypothetical protein VMG38_15330 [Trebonia sp.]|nr:hypothetical protein [Trebonia sp.]